MEPELSVRQTSFFKDRRHPVVEFLSLGVSALGRHRPFSSPLSVPPLTVLVDCGGIYAFPEAIVTTASAQELWPCPRQY